MPNINSFYAIQSAFLFLSFSWPLYLFFFLFLHIFNIRNSPVNLFFCGILRAFLILQLGSSWGIVRYEAINNTIKIHLTLLYFIAWPVWPSAKAQRVRGLWLQINFNTSSHFFFLRPSLIKLTFFSRPKPALNSLS